MLHVFIMRRVRVSDQNEAPQAAADAAPAEAAAETPTHNGAQPEVESQVETQLTELQKQIETFREGWQRERAEFANFKKRIEREKLELYQNATSDVLKSLLPILDDFDRAVDNLPEDLRDHPWVDGVLGIQRKMLRLLEQFNITVVDPTGQPFDPNLHEALGTDESDAEPGTVTATMQKGYLVGERVLRPALVRVAG
jgi:molecular chaperone GrpE